MRDECKGCLIDGTLLYCAVKDLQRAWYCLLRDTPFLNRFAKEPEPCYLRESEKHDENE